MKNRTTSDTTESRKKEDIFRYAASTFRPHAGHPRYLCSSNAWQCNILESWEAIFRCEALAAFQTLAEEASFGEDHHPLELPREINLEAKTLLTRITAKASESAQLDSEHRREFFLMMSRRRANTRRCSQGDRMWKGGRCQFFDRKESFQIFRNDSRDSRR